MEQNENLAEQMENKSKETKKEAQKEVVVEQKEEIKEEKKQEEPEEELQNKRNELDVGDKFDVIEYNRNRKLSIVVEGLYSKYCRNYNKYYDLDKFLRHSTVSIQKACATNNLKTEQVIQKLKQKIKEN